MEGINYLGGIVLISVMLISIERQAAVNPGFNLFGMSIAQIRTIAYVSIGAYIILILREIF